MPNRNRAAGDAFEYRTRDTFETRGWWIIRAAGSLGAVDLVGLKAEQPPVLISCKISGRIDPRERVLLLAVARLTGGIPVVAHREKPGWIGLSRLVEPDSRVAIGTWHMPPRGSGRPPPEEPGEP